MKWITGQYGFNYLRLGNGIEASVGWSGEGYKVRCLGMDCPILFKEREQAERFAVDRLRLALISALKRIGEVECPKQ